MEGFGGRGMKSALLTVAEHKHGCEGQLPTKMPEAVERGREARRSERKVMWEVAKEAAAVAKALSAYMKWIARKKQKASQ